MFTQEQVLEKITASRKLTQEQNEEIFRNLKARIEAIGIPVREFTSKTVFGWDGKILSLEGGTIDRQIADLAHEFSHWLVCSPSRRHLPEFGLGAGFSTRDTTTARKFRKISSENTVKEEVATCYVAAFLLYEIGADVFGESENVSIVTDEGELYGSWKADRNRIQQAIRRGAINEKLEIIWPEVA